MKLSEHITDEMLSTAAVESAGLEEVTQSIDAQFEGASLDAIKNFHAGIMFATATIAQCDSVDQLILALATVQTAIEAKIAKFDPSDGSSDL